MGKLADAIRERRKSGQRRLGFGAAAQERQPSMLVAATGVVDGVDICLALSEEEMAAAESAELAVWGTRVDELTPDSVAAVKERGGVFAAFEIESARADALLDEDMDYVVRLADLRLDQADARALGSLRPAVIAVEVEFPLSLAAVLDLRRLAMLSAAPLGVACPADVSAGDIEALRDSGAAVLLLGPGASADDAAALKQRILDLPERKTKRDDDAQPLIPTMRPGAEDGSEEG